MLTWIRTNAADVTDFAYIFTCDDNGNSLERTEDGTVTVPRTKLHRIPMMLKAIGHRNE